ncbi:MAG TPA: hypothetical protein VFW95_02645 [Candidatus Limnocylindria bacterium]|nr:hypothetical protein [Candidatus Limnocylindria bacterium]
MTTDRGTTRAVRSWLEEGVDRLPDRVLDAVLDQLPATHQRGRAWWTPRKLDRLSGMTLVIASAAIVVAVLLGLDLISRQNVGNSEPDATPATSAASLPRMEGSELDAGRYALEGFPVQVQFDLPAGWVACSSSVVEQVVCTAPRTGGEIGLSFLVVENVVADPCGDRLLDPPVGPSVDDLVVAIVNLDGFTADAPRDVGVSGFPGKEISITAPAASACALLTWSMGTRTNGVGNGERNVLRIVDVDGTRVMFAAASFPGVTPAESVAELSAIMDSIQIGKP